MGGAAEAVETVRIGISVEVRELDLREACAAEAMGYVPGEVEMRFSLRARDEKALIGLIGVEEALAEGLIHFVGGLRDTWADSGGDPLAPGPEALHRFDGGVCDARDRPAPPGMRRADHAGIGIGEENWRAIRGKDAEQDAGAIRHHRIGVRTLCLRPRRFDKDGVAGVNLMHRGKRSARRYGFDSALPVFFDCRPVVLASKADVQARELTGRDASAPAEEAVWDVGETARANDLDLAHSSFFMMMS